MPERLVVLVLFFLWRNQEPVWLLGWTRRNLSGEIALVYLWRGSLVTPIVMHFLQDFLGIVLLPLLTGR